MRGEAIPADGRLRRSQRSGQAIVEALLGLIGDGVLEPTAQQVAERAAVGIRTVFRRFSDMESLFAEMDARLQAEALPLLLGGRPQGTPRDRALGLVRQRVAFFNASRPTSDLAHEAPALAVCATVTPGGRFCARSCCAGSSSCAAPPPSSRRRPHHLLRGMGPPAQRAELTCARAADAVERTVLPLSTLPPEGEPHADHLLRIVGPGYPTAALRAGCATGAFRMPDHPRIAGEPRPPLPRVALPQLIVAGADGHLLPAPTPRRSSASSRRCMPVARLPETALAFADALWRTMPTTTRRCSTIAGRSPRTSPTPPPSCRAGSGPTNRSTTLSPTARCLPNARSGAWGSSGRMRSPGR
jgi:AcrR family transcriptional regulator